jgi:hypothetical protein
VPRARNRKAIIGALTLVVTLFTSGKTLAVEKYWIAHEATLIVVGTLHPGRTFPWFDGWHMSGTIDVEDVLFGPRVVGRIDYRLVLPFGEVTQRWPPPRFAPFFTAKGLWFLRPLDRGSWLPSFGIGFADLSARRDFETYIHRYKQIPSH